MFDKEKLANVISNSGLKKGYIAASIHMSPQSFKRKMDGEKEWKCSEVYGLSRVLDMTPEQVISIFFA